jgi:hypothetical protein
VPWLIGTAVAYALTLYLISDDVLTMPKMAAFRTIVLTFGGYSVLFLAVSIWFTLRKE